MNLSKILKSRFDKRRSSLANQNGAFLVTAALMMTPLLGMSLLATELGMVHLVRTEMSNGADLASLAAIKNFANSGGAIDTETLASARRAAAVTGQLNSTRYHHTIEVDTAPVTDNAGGGGDIVFGFYNHSKKNFTGYPDSEVIGGEQIINAIRTRIGLGEGENEPVTFQLARAVIKNEDSMLAMTTTVSEAVATFGLMNIIPVFDISASMDNATYRPLEECSHANLLDQQSRWFQWAARPEVFGTCEEDPDMNVFGPVHPDYNVVMPQPITSVFEVARDNLLNENRLFQGLYRGGLIVYETTAYAPYSPSGDSLQLTPTSQSNKATIESAINHAIEQWRIYALNGPYSTPEYAALAQTYPNLPFPGGLNPPETTFTNTGDAIFRGVEWISMANQATHTQNTDVLILFSDGIPNCYRLPVDDPVNANWELPPHCPRTGDIRPAAIERANELIDQIVSTFPRKAQRAIRAVLERNMGQVLEIMINDLFNDYSSKGEQWSLSNAHLAHQHGIQIHSVYFGAGQEEGCSERNAGFQHLRQVSSVAGGSSYCAENIDELAVIFSELATKQSFVLVNPTSTENG